MARRPDSPLAAGFSPSPNHGERAGGRKPDWVVLHYTGMPTGDAALERLCDPAAEVSCHYLVWEDGRILQLVAEDRRAWHAGASRWQGERDMNSASIGIEIVNPGHVNGVPTPFPPAQIDAVAALCGDIFSRRAIPPTRALAHSDIAPGRKIDPGEMFPWQRLAGLGVGVWPRPAAGATGATLREDDAGADVRELQADLARIGYDLEADGVFGPRARAVVAAFQRHFRPSRVDGEADAETVALARALRMTPFG